MKTVTVSNTVACSAAPAAPTALTTTASTLNSVTLSWTAPTPPSGCSITKYGVYQSTVLVSSPTTNSYTVTGLTPNTRYSFSVTAADSAGTSAQSTVLSATTSADTTPPAAPTGATATAPSAGQVQLKWTAATDNVGVAYYRVYRNGTLLPLTTTATTYTDSTVTANTAYTYTISAVDTSGE